MLNAKYYTNGSSGSQTYFHEPSSSQFGCLGKSIPSGPQVGIGQRKNNTLNQV